MAALKLVANKPEAIALAFAEGKPVPSAFGGDQVMFSLVDGRQLYVSPYVASKIDELSLGKGEMFTIEKKETISGNRRSVDYVVSHMPESAALQRAYAALKSEAVPVPRGGPDPAVRTNAVAVRPNGNGLPPSGSEVAASHIPQNNPQDNASNLDLSLRYAIDAAVRAEAYAKGINYAVRFTSEDIRAMALSKFISMDRNGNGSAKWSN